MSINGSHRSCPFAPTLYLYRSGYKAAFGTGICMSKIQVVCYGVKFIDFVGYRNLLPMYLKMIPESVTLFGLITAEGADPHNNLLMYRLDMSVDVRFIVKYHEICCIYYGLSYT